MKTALDTNIVSAILSREPSAPRIVSALQKAREAGGLIISPPAYAECLAHPFHPETYIESFLAETEIVVSMPLRDDVWKMASHRYRQYAIRRRQSRAKPPRRILADFLIGTHALIQADQLLTLDLRIYHNYFPELRCYPIEE